MITALGIGLLAIALVAAGCGDDDESMPPAQTNEDQSAGLLRGQAFASTAVTEDGEPRALVAGTRIRLRFGAGEDLRWYAGCNHFGADVEIAADIVVVGQIAGTEIGCPAELQEQDEWVAGFLGSDPGWHVSDGGLTLTTDEGVIEFEAAAG
jgi:heat shock protein HslJ